MHATLLVLRVLHIVSAVFWGGATIFFSFFLEPSLRPMGPGAWPLLLGLNSRRLFSILPAVAGITVLAGASMLWIDSSGFSPAWMGSAPGMAYSIGGAFGLLALLIGAGVMGPSGSKLVALVQEATKTSQDPARDAIAAKMAPLRERLRLGGRFAAAFLVAAAISMALARYL